MGIRKEEYQRPDGTRVTNRQLGARFSTKAQIKIWADNHSSRIPPGYFVATAERESGRAFNEIDTEPNGFVSIGLYQVSMNEADDVGLPGADLTDPEMATRVFVRVAERNLDYILKYAPDAKEPDLWAYLCIAHNEGLKAVKTTIEGHGLVWGDPVTWPKPSEDRTTTAKPEWAYRRRNDTRKIVAYGDAILEEIRRG